MSKSKLSDVEGHWSGFLRVYSTALLLARSSSRALILAQLSAHVLAFLVVALDELLHQNVVVFTRGFSCTSKKHACVVMEACTGTR